MKIVLFEPQIPQNAGNIVRTCKASGCSLLLVRPLGFSVNDRWLKRAGLDYWDGVDVSFTDDLEAYLANIDAPFYFFSSKAKKLYTDVSYSSDCLLIFGSETSGLPQKFFTLYPEQFVTLPMKPDARCLNLANSVAIATYEALRQQNFPLH